MNKKIYILFSFLSLSFNAFSADIMITTNISPADVSGSYGLMSSDITNFWNSTDTLTLTNSNITAPSSETDNTLTGQNEPGDHGFINNEWSLGADEVLSTNAPSSIIISGTNTIIRGGAGGNVNLASSGIDPDTSDVTGGTAFKEYGVAKDIQIESASFYGGNGGVGYQASAVGVTADALVSAHGGHGVSIRRGTEYGDASSNYPNISSDAEDPGNFWPEVTELTPAIVEVSSGNFYGGHGGTNDTARQNAQANAINLKTTLDEVGARGGHGFEFLRNDQIPLTHEYYNEAYRLDLVSGGDPSAIPELQVPSSNDTIIVTGGTFVGGNGGFMTNGNQNSSLELNAQGGNGLFAAWVDVVVEDGYFQGGDAGITNGVSDRSGAGIHTIDSNLTIHDGVFTNNIGLRIDNIFYNTTNIIHGGDFSDIEITSFDDHFASTPITSYTEIRGGNINDIFVGGDEANILVITNTAAINSLVLSLEDSNIKTNQINISGSAELDHLNILSGNNEIMLADNAFVLGTNIIIGGTNYIENQSSSAIRNFTISGGETEVIGWGSNDFNYVSMSSGELSFKENVNNSNHQFDLLSGGVIELDGGMINFDHDFVAHENAQVNIYDGNLVASNIILEAGSKVGLMFEGGTTAFSPVGSLVSSNRIDISNDVTFELNDQTNSTTALSKENLRSLTNANGFLLLSSASDELNHALTTDDVTLNFDVSDEEWIYVINDINVVTNGSRDQLYASYGISTLPNVLDTSGKLLNVVNAIDSVDTESNDILYWMNDRFDSKDDALTAIKDSYLRTSEMGYALVSLQSVIADHVRVRTGNYRNNERFFYKSPYGPRGPADVRNPYISGKSKYSFPRFNIPPNYQAWGRGYYTDLDKKDSSVNYNYNGQVSGGILGVDYTYDNLMVGFSGGYAETQVQGGYSFPDISGYNGESSTIHGGVYASARSSKSYIDVNINYSKSDVETKGPSSMGYAAEYGANNLNFYTGLGTELLRTKNILIIPEVSVMSSLYSREKYTETSRFDELPDKVFSSLSEWTYKAEAGLDIIFLKFITRVKQQMVIQPEISVHWIHHFDPYLTESYLLEGSTSSIGTITSTNEESLFRLGIGLNIWDLSKYNTEFRWDIDSTSGSDYQEFTMSANFIHRF